MYHIWKVADCKKGRVRNGDRLLQVGVAQCLKQWDRGSLWVVVGELKDSPLNGQSYVCLFSPFCPSGQWD